MDDITRRDNPCLPLRAARCAVAVLLVLSWLGTERARAQQADASGDTAAEADASGDTAAEADTSGDAAAEAGASGDAGAGTVHSPVLTHFAWAEYPALALAEGAEGEVLLRLSIDADGAVTEAEVVGPAGHGFDDAARAAALRFRFTPARRGDRAVPSRILYAYEFRLPAPITTPAPADLDPSAGAAGLSGDGVDSVAQEDGARSGRVSADSAGASTDDAASAEPVLEVTVRGQSEADRLRQSARAIHVIETEQARRQTADLGDVLARSEGVGVRRGGGLGSAARLSLNGLTGDQVRFFLDGIPLELAGYPLGVANVPVNLVDRVEVYRGVVPVQFGADALGGAVHLVSNRDVRGTRASASYQAGSFDTYRMTVGARHMHEPTGLFARVDGFLDRARNDYAVGVDVPDAQGRLSPASAHRFHDGYGAAGGGAEVGLVSRPWAERLLLRVFHSAHDKDVQHNVLMTVPYGEVTYGKQSTGGNLRYAQPLSSRARVDAVAGYAQVRTTFRDLSTCRYDWFGRCVAELPQPGEIEARAIDQSIWQGTAFARFHAVWQLAPEHLLRIAVAPTYATRTGVDRAISAGDYDPLAGQRDLLTAVTGVEWELTALSDRLVNVAFVKGYLQAAQADEELPNGNVRDVNLTRRRAGGGDSLRLRLTDAVHAKASYEYATRLPGPDEIFGDGVLIADNLDIEPEASHNLNLGVFADRADARGGTVRLGASAFARLTRDLVVLLGDHSYFQYENVLAARSLGVESSAGWTSPRERLAIDGTVTWQDFRNASRDGAFRDFEGDRIPNRPYLSASVRALARWPELTSQGDALSVTWQSHYVHAFYRSWDSAGAASSKLVIPTQLTSGVAVTYEARRAARTLSATLEVHNLTNERVFDFFGVQRPGRAMYGKLVLSL